ncbi:MAG: cellulose biosynthesis cyclic di-GMP-binding regulatory protein BcsB, partial [Candidatus Eremiobacteraeota bacterium]|nr:cellulose biosynthesis cyclic di-GMP-binding regulatory protein BcsB [Candidatus Eremiobacteraeota bacterium]
LALLCSVGHAQAASVVIPFSELGYGSDQSLGGPNPKFGIFVPVYPQLKALHVHIPLRISPLIDRRSSLTLMVNERPVFTESLASLGAAPVIDQTIMVPSGPRTSMEVALQGKFFRKGDICFDLDTSDFWLNVLHTGSLTAITGPVAHKPFIRDFLQDYRGSIRIVMPQNANTQSRYSALRLAYYLHQINRWRHTSVTMAASRDAAGRNIVFGSFSEPLQVRGNDLYANADGVTLLNHQLDSLLVTSSVTAVQYDQHATEAVRERTFEDLGMPTQTQTGIDEMPFQVPLALNEIGGLPSNLHLHVALTHTALVPEDRASVKIMVNNTLEHSFGVRPEGGEEDFDVPINDDVLRSSNDVKIVPSYYSKRSACKGGYPRMTTSLLGSSTVSWDTLDRGLHSVGDFYNMASGRVAVLVAGDSLVPYAFAVLDSLGTVNASVKQLDVQAYNGSIPDGYDYAIVVSPPDQLGSFSVPLKPGGKDFSLIEKSSGKVLYRAQYAQPFGILQVGAKEAPSTLFATYWKDPGVAAGLSRIEPSEVAAQSDDVFLFNQEQATYSSTADTPAAHRGKVDRVRQAMIPIIGVFALLLLALIMFTAQRARRAS